MRVELYYVVRTDQYDHNTYAEYISGPHPSWLYASESKVFVERRGIGNANYEVVKQTIEVEL